MLEMIMKGELPSVGVVEKRALMAMSLSTIQNTTENGPKSPTLSAEAT